MAPPDSVAEAVLVGAEAQEGTYLVLMKWFPGWMSAPHTYVTDRLCVVVSGVWWCNSGPDFDPDNAVPVYPGWIRAPGGTNAALRRGAGRGRRTRGHRGDRNGAGQTDLGGPGAAAAAASMNIDEEAFGERPAADQEPLLRPPPERNVDLPLVWPAR